MAHLEIGEEDDVEPIHWGAMVGSTFTLVNAAVSASLLTLPYAFKKAGIIQGVFLVVILGILARFIDWRLVRYGHRFKSTSYAGMIATALGDRVGIFLSSLVAVSLFAGLVGLLILVGDLVTPIMQYWFGPTSILAHRTPLIILVSVLFIVPLGSLPSVNMLQYSSFLTFASLVFMTISIIVRYSQKVGSQPPNPSESPVVLWNWSWGVLKAIPIIWYNSGFIFQAIPVLVQRPKQFTHTRNAFIMAAVTLIVALLMTTLGIPGYLTFFERSNGNILTNYAIDDPLIGICRALVTVVVVCSYPLFNMPLREALFYLFRQFKEYRANKSNPSQLTLAAPQILSPSSPFSSEDPNSPDTISTSSEDTSTSTDAEMIKLDFDAKVQVPPVLFDEAPLEVSVVNSQQQANSAYAVWMRSFIQTFVCWILAFTLAYVIPDITVVIGFVASTFSPVYYFALPGLVALSLPEKKTATRVGGYFLLSLCALFIASGIGTYFLPKNIPTPPLSPRHTP